MAKRVVVIERTLTDGQWMVGEHKPDVFEILFDGTAQECVEWCFVNGGFRVGPRVFEMED